jgi:predicted ATPase
MGRTGRVRTPDQRLRVFVSSTLIELRSARSAARRAIEQLHLSPVMIDLGARPHPPRELYQAYLEQSDVFIGIYWQSYGWVGFGAQISGVEDELRLAAGMPRLLYVQEPAPDRDPRLEALLDEVRAEAATSYKQFGDPEELEAYILDDLAVLLTERFETYVDSAAPAPAADPRNVVLEPMNPLIGRETEVATVRAWLESGTARLITLSGPGGVGKSRLALELTKLVEDDFPGGVWTVLLEAVRDPALVLATIARTLQLRTGITDDPAEVLQALVAHLSDRRVLLVLDNFEHVLAAAPDLARLIASCAGLHVLVTSRSSLRVRAERELMVAPLPVPVADAETSEQLEASAAVQLFLARAEAVNRRLPTDEATLRAVAEICRRLDGLPLAIELAAARVRLLPPQQLLQRLERSFAVLTGGTTDMPERHQTLRATIDWGYDLLDPAEQLALQRLAVFSGGWTLAAAEEVLTAPGELGADVLDVLDGLVTKSFVTAPAGSGPSPRFGMLQTVREYAQERLLASPDLEATVDAHVAYFLALAEHAAPQLYGPDQMTWFEALEEDHDNLLAALHRLEDRGDAERQLRLTVSLGRLWLVHSHLTEAKRWMARAMAYSAGRRDRLRADLLTWAGWLALFVRGDTEAAEQISNEALAIRRELGDRHGEAVELLALGNVTVFRGDAPEAQRRYRETADLAEASGDTEVLGRAVGNLGVVARANGDLDEAERALRQGCELMRSLGDDHAVAQANLNLSGVLLDRGDLSEAEALAQAAVRQSQRVGDETNLVEALENLSAVWAEQGRLAAAAWLYGAAESKAQSVSLVRSALEAPLYERYVTRARERAAASGQAALFEALWTAGEAAPTRAVVAVALGEQPVPGVGADEPVAG